MLLLVTSSIVNNISCVQKWHLARWPIWVETSTLPRAYIYLGTSRVSDVAIIFALICVFHLCLSYTVSSPSDTSLGPHFNFYWRVYPAKQQTRTQVPSNAKYHQTPTTKTNKRNVNILHLCNKLLSLTHFNDLTTEQLHTPPPYSTITSSLPTSRLKAVRAPRAARARRRERLRAWRDTTPATRPPAKRPWHASGSSLWDTHGLFMFIYTWVVSIDRIGSPSS